MRRTDADWSNLPTTYDNEAADIEMAKNASVAVHSLVLVTYQDRDTIDLEVIVDIKRYSTKLRLLRVTAWILKFIRSVRATRSQPVQKGLNANNLKEAELKWLKSLQKHEFSIEYATLLSGKNVVYNNQFILFLENGVIQCRGRVNQADLLISAKNPVLLPEKHY